MVEHEHVWCKARIVSPGPRQGQQIELCPICLKSRPVVVEENTSERLERDDPTV